MNTADYPDAIYQERLKVAEANQAVRELRRRMDEAELEIEIEVLSDKDLKNEAARKAAKEMLLRANSLYQLLIRDMDKALLERATLEASLEKLINQFSLERLGIRERIASAVDLDLMAG